MANEKFRTATNARGVLGELKGNESLGCTYENPGGVFNDGSVTPIDLKPIISTGWFSGALDIDSQEAYVSGQQVNTLGIDINGTVVDQSVLNAPYTAGYFAFIPFKLPLNASIESFVVKGFGQAANASTDPQRWGFCLYDALSGDQLYSSGSINITADTTASHQISHAISPPVTDAINVVAILAVENDSLGGTALQFYKLQSTDPTIYENGVPGSENENDSGAAAIGFLSPSDPDRNIADLPASLTGGSAKVMFSSTPAPWCFLTFSIVTT